MLVQTSVEEVFADVVRHEYTCYTHEELWFSSTGQHAYFQNDGLKNKHEEQRKEAKMNEILYIK